jgi:hypothetical protein
VIVIAGVLDERIAMAIATILRAARQNSQPVFVLDPLETEVYVIARKRLVAATLPPCNGLSDQSGGIYWVRCNTHTISRASGHLSRLLIWNGTPDVIHAQAR